MKLEDRLIKCISIKTLKGVYPDGATITELRCQLISASREAIYQDLLELIGEDELEVGHKEYYDTDRAITRNQLRAELRNKLKGYCGVKG